MTEKKESHSNYKGFVAGVFSGIAKLSGMFNIPAASSKSRLGRFLDEIQVG